jgi:hypothetical protein
MDKGFHGANDLTDMSFGRVYAIGCGAADDAGDQTAGEGGSK